MINPKEPYNLHWPVRRGRLNVHAGLGGSLSAVLQDLEDIIVTALQTFLEISRPNIKVGCCFSCFTVHIYSLVNTFTIWIILSMIGVFIWEIILRKYG
jgi:hypothetical protein